MSGLKIIVISGNILRLLINTNDTKNYRAPGIEENTFLKRAALYPFVSTLVDGSQSLYVLNQYVPEYMCLDDCRRLRQGRQYPLQHSLKYSTILLVYLFLRFFEVSMTPTPASRTTYRQSRGKRL